ncbi:hypothetical protein JCM19000A_42650 [Silvimonas sp. JCM 19000]
MEMGILDPISVTALRASKVPTFAVAGGVIGFQIGEGCMAVTAGACALWCRFLG